jgi:hypothetical protein
MTNADRTAAEARFRDEHGCGLKDAALAARALYPFDDGVEPGSAFADQGIRRARRFGTEVAGLRGNEVGVAAERAVEELLDLARDHHEMHYVTLFEEALEATDGPVSPPESGE